MGTIVVVVVIDVGILHTLLRILLISTVALILLPIIASVLIAKDSLVYASISVVVVIVRYSPSKLFFIDSSTIFLL